MSWARGKKVAFTGRLASMTRPEAAELVRRHGGTPVPGVTRQTQVLVVGQEGWPLLPDGSLSRKLEKARRVRAQGRDLVILAEDDFLRKLGLEDASADIQRRFSLAQLCRFLKVPRDRLRSWIRAGLIEPVEVCEGIQYFDFRQAAGVRTLWDLSRAGIGADRLRKSLEQLARWLPEMNVSPAQLAFLERGGKVLLRLEEGQVVEPSGQLQLDFGDDDHETGPATVEVQPEVSGEEWFRRGCAHEEQGMAAEAEEAYRRALLADGPKAETCFNLANVLYAQGHLGRAAERYWQAVEMDGGFGDAWNNLGNVLWEMGRPEEALDAYRKALAVDPRRADAHYNLADALDQLGRSLQAQRHWKEYLALEPWGEGADWARRCLAR